MNARRYAKQFTGKLAPIYIYNHAEAFLDAADREFDAADGISIPGYFLVGRAAELALKSYLLAHGASEDDLRRIGHNLELALAEVNDLELPEHCEEALVWLNPYYSGKDLEYPKTGFKHLPSREALQEIVRGLLKAVETDVWSTGPRRG